MNYAEANYNLCPHCNKRGLPKPQEGVTAVACMHCHAEIETTPPEVITHVECHCGTVGEFPKPLPGAEFVEYQCGNCGGRYQHYVGKKAVFLGPRVWDRVTRSWRSPGPPKTVPRVTQDVRTKEKG